MERLTVWCVRLLTVQWVQPPRIGKEAVRPRRMVVTQQPLAVLERMLRGRAMVFLPEHRAAGPCGTNARVSCSRSAMAWSVEKLVPPLQAWYAEQALPKDPRAGIRLGAKAGGGNGRAALW